MRGSQPFSSTSSAEPRDPRGFAGKDGDQHLLEERQIDAAEQADRLLLVDHAVAEGGQLVEQRNGVADTPFAGAGEQGERRVARLDLFRAADVAQVGDRLDVRDAPEVELLAARQDGRRHGLDLGGGEDEDQARRRLLDDLQQRVERLARQSMDFVEDDHFVAIARRTVLEALGELAHLLDLRVGRGVDLEHVHVGAGGDLPACRTLVARAVRGAELAVERLGEDARGGRLADAADAGEEIGLRDAALAQRIRERRHDGLLADERRKRPAGATCGRVPGRPWNCVEPEAKGSGTPAAPEARTLSLLPSGPDEVRNRSMHRT